MDIILSIFVVYLVYDIYRKWWLPRKPAYKIAELEKQAEQFKEFALRVIKII